MSAKSKAASFFRAEDLAATCKAAAAAGDTTFNTVFSTDIAGANFSVQCHWANLNATCRHHVAPDGTVSEVPAYTQWLRMKCSGVSARNIDPFDAADLAIENTRRIANKIAPLRETREANAQITTEKYTCDVKKSPDDNLLVIVDPETQLPLRASDGLPVTPDDIYIPGYVAECVNTWFVTTISTAKKAGIITTDGPMPGEAKDPSKLVTSNPKICPLVQTHVSSNSPGPSAGKKLPQPLFRFRLKFAKTTHVSGGLIYGFMVDGAAPEFLTHDRGAGAGKELVNARNVHAVVTKGSEFKGIIEMTSICFSNLGISIPCTASVIAIKPKPSFQKPTISDLFDEVAISAPAAPAALAAPAAPAAPAVPAMAPDDIERLLAEAS
jgi:hypothetical protein